MGAKRPNLYVMKTVFKILFRFEMLFLFKVIFITKHFQQIVNCEYILSLGSKVKLCSGLLTWTTLLSKKIHYRDQKDSWDFSRKIQFGVPCVVFKVSIYLYAKLEKKRITIDCHQIRTIIIDARKGVLKNVDNESSFWPKIKIICFKFL